MHRKAYTPPSKEELKAAGDKRKAAALAAAKEKYGEDFTPATRSARPYRGTASETFKKPKTTPDERKAASQEKWREQNPGKPDPPSFANMQKAVYAYLHMEKGALGAVGKLVGGAAKGAAKVGAKVAGGTLQVAEGVLGRGESGKSLVGNLGRLGESSAAEHQTKQPKMTGMEMNMEKQEPEWTTPQTETPLQKFLDHSKRNQT
jgi:hypothetical protein